MKLKFIIPMVWIFCSKYRKIVFSMMEKIAELLFIHKNVVLIMMSKVTSNWILQRHQWYKYSSQYFCTTQTGEEVLSKLQHSPIIMSIMMEASSDPEIRSVIHTVVSGSPRYPMKIATTNPKSCTILNHLWNAVDMGAPTTSINCKLQ